MLIMMCKIVPERIIFSHHQITNKPSYRFFIQDLYLLVVLVNSDTFFVLRNKAKLCVYRKYKKNYARWILFAHKNKMSKPF